MWAERANQLTINIQLKTNEQITYLGTFSKHAEMIVIWKYSKIMLIYRYTKRDAGM